MTKTEAADTVALRLTVNSRKAGRTPTRRHAEELVSEMRGGHLGGFYREAATIAHPRTVHRIALANLRATGDL